MSPAASPPSWVVHLLARDGEQVRPLCGDWSKSPNWTTEPDVVTCPECAARAVRAAVPGRWQPPR
jgi:hypothetical protein